jgi:flagellar biosynthesis/type III secretory pathway protein FliH
MSEEYDNGYNDGYDEGYSDGEFTTQKAIGEAFTAIHKWLEERGVLKWEDHPDGLNADDLMELIYEHERSLVLKAKQSVTH